MDRSNCNFSLADAIKITQEIRNEKSRVVATRALMYFVRLVWDVAYQCGRADQLAKHQAIKAKQEAEHRSPLQVYSFDTPEELMAFLDKLGSQSKDNLSDTFKSPPSDSPFHIVHHAAECDAHCTDRNCPYIHKQCWDLMRGDYLIGTYTTEQEARVALHDALGKSPYV